MSDTTTTQAAPQTRQVMVTIHYTCGCGAKFVGSKEAMFHCASEQHVLRINGEIRPAAKAHGGRVV